MRVLVLGAGALGGFFGGRLVEAGRAEVAFLVRPGRKAQLDRDGLVIESPAGNFRAPVRTLVAGDLRPGWDLVLLTAKAYDLEGAIAAIRPAVDRTTAVLPVLNGMTHIQALQDAFGPGCVLGGLAQIQATLAADGTVRHLAKLALLEFGELDGTMSARVRALEAAYGGSSTEARAVSDITGAMWAKLVFLGSLAATTVLLRANLGEVAAAPGGEAWYLRMLERTGAIAAANGHPVAAETMANFGGFARNNPAAAASMLRDLESGGRIEADHILGFLLEAARRAGIEATLHETAYIHAKAYEARRAAGRLPGRVSPPAP
ncbi:MAG: 2-dehydropantoate 2-reductase [Acetobacteraceae bacterium]|nr:2-dehydropantoate 2-reductase [Acetobacteraceae bacterium]